jgi:hypothetical protein
MLKNIYLILNNINWSNEDSIKMVLKMYFLTVSFNLNRNFESKNRRIVPQIKVNTKLAKGPNRQF